MLSAVVGKLLLRVIESGLKEFCLRGTSRIGSSNRKVRDIVSSTHGVEMH